MTEVCLDEEKITHSVKFKAVCTCRRIYFSKNKIGSVKIDIPKLFREKVYV